MNPSQVINILVVDDNCLLIKALENVFKNSNYISIIGGCSRDSEILPFIKCNKTDVIFMELMAKKVNGFKAIKRVKEYNSKIKIIGFSFINYTHFIDEIMAAGADGFISKYDSDKKVMEKEVYRIMRL